MISLAGRAGREPGCSPLEPWRTDEGRSRHARVTRPIETADRIIEAVERAWEALQRSAAPTDDQGEEETP